MSEKKKFILTIVAGALVAVGLGVLIYFQQEEIDRTREEARNLREQVAAGRELVEGTADLEREVIIQRETDELIKEILPNDADINTFVKTLQSFGEASGILISQIKGKHQRTARKQTRDFEEEGYTLTFKGDAFQLLAFLDQVETHSRFMSVPNFKLSAAKRRSATDPTASLHQVTLDVVTYVYQPKEGSKSLKIDNYERKRELLLGEIAQRRAELAIPGYRYHGSRGRRDPWVDPRIPSGGGQGMLSVEDQISLVDELVDQARKVEEIWEELEAAENLIAEMKARKALLEEMGPLEEEVRRIEESNKLTFVSAERRFQMDVVDFLSDLREQLETSEGGRGPTAAALRESIDAMKRHLQAGEYELALAVFEAIEPRLPLAEGDELRTALVEELRALERLPRTVLAFEQISLDIKGVIVDEEQAVAVINGQSVTAGEMLDSGLIVRAIQPNEIEFLYQGIALVRRIEEQ